MKFSYKNSFLDSTKFFNTQYLKVINILIIILFLIFLIGNHKNFLNMHVLQITGLFVTLMIIEILLNLYKIDIDNTNEKIGAKFYVFKFIEIIIMIVLLVITADKLVYSILAVAVLSVYIVKGKQVGGKILIFTFLINITTVVFLGYEKYGDKFYYEKEFINEQLLETIIIYISLLLSCNLIVLLYERFIVSTNENLKLLEELNRNFENITETQDELKLTHAKLISLNKKVDESKKHVESTLDGVNFIQRVIESINCESELSVMLNNINEVISSCLKISNSSIIFYNEKRFVLYSSTIYPKNELAVITDNLDCDILFEVINENKTIYDNNALPEKFPFIKERNIKAVMCIPIRSKIKIYGVLILEHVLGDVFNAVNSEMLTIGSQMIALAIENASNNKKIQDSVWKDSLTDVYTKSYFYEKLNDEIIKSQQNKYQSCLALIDIDGISSINNKYGYEAGDLVLKHVAKISDETIRNADIIGRNGEDGFIIFLPNITIERANDRMDKLRLGIEESVINYNNNSIKITVSIGIVSYPKSAKNFKQLIEIGETALKKAKQLGYNKVFFEQM